MGSPFVHRANEQSPLPHGQSSLSERKIVKFWPFLFILRIQIRIHSFRSKLNLKIRKKPLCPKHYRSMSFTHLAVWVSSPRRKGFSSSSPHPLGLCPSHYATGGAPRLLNHTHTCNHNRLTFRIYTSEEEKRILHSTLDSKSVSRCTNIVGAQKGTAAVRTKCCSLFRDSSVCCFAPNLYQ